MSVPAAMPSRLHDSAPWRTCPDCDAPYRRHLLRPREKLVCRRCGVRLSSYQGGVSLQAILALAFTGLLLLLMANTSPIMTFDVAGRIQSNLVITGVQGLVQQGYGVLALLVFFCSILAPALYLLLLIYALVPLVLGMSWPGLGFSGRLILFLAPWNLVPVFIVACGIAVVRLELMGRVVWQSGALYALLLSVCCLVLGRIFPRERVEILLEEAR